MPLHPEPAQDDEKSDLLKGTIMNEFVRVEEVHGIGLGLVAFKPIPSGTTWFRMTSDNNLVIPRNAFEHIRRIAKGCPEWESLRQSIQLFSWYNSSEDAINFPLDNVRYMNHAVDCNSTYDEPPEGAYLGAPSYTNCDIRPGEEIRENYLSYPECPWADLCDSFLKPQPRPSSEDFVGQYQPVPPAEIMITRGQFRVYAESNLSRDVDKALLLVLAKTGIFDEERQAFILRIPTEGQ
ncbi:hypothetical protein Dda_5851 [Drechslerella dactyloides]|uniref:SET domain-containing protein n=1 Tax=Drechslerella dactyloides TaxID=74499 RepID=A0AAD6NGP6_DREDA|nr:hypothetical protein Dda_5851 [Drechslerella dactyloides]